MTADDDTGPAFLAGGVRMPDPRLVEPLSIFRDASGQVWQAVPSAAATVAGLRPDPRAGGAGGRPLGPVRLDCPRRHRPRPGRCPLPAVAPRPLRRRCARRDGAAVPLVVTLLVIRRRRAYARVVDREVTPTTITLPTGAVERRR